MLPCNPLTLGTMQIVAPFHTDLEYGHEFPTNYVVACFHGCEILAEERHWALLLQQFSPQPNHGCITTKFEGLAKVWELQHRCRCQFGLNSVKCTLLFQPPHKWTFIQQQVTYWRSCYCKMWYKAIIEVGKTKKLLNAFNIGRWFSAGNGCHLIVINT